MSNMLSIWQNQNNTSSHRSVNVGVIPILTNRKLNTWMLVVCMQKSNGNTNSELNLQKSPFTNPFKSKRLYFLRKYGCSYPSLRGRQPGGNKALRSDISFSHDLAHGAFPKHTKPGEGIRTLKNPPNPMKVLYSFRKLISL